MGRPENYDFYKTMLGVYKKHDPNNDRGRRALIYLMNAFSNAVEHFANSHCQTAENRDQLVDDMQKIRRILHPWS